MVRAGFAIFCNFAHFFAKLWRFVSYEVRGCARGCFEERRHQEGIEASSLEEKRLVSTFGGVTLRKFGLPSGGPSFMRTPPAPTSRFGGCPCHPCFAMLLSDLSIDRSLSIMNVRTVVCWRIRGVGRRGF